MLSRAKYFVPLGMVMMNPTIALAEAADSGTPKAKRMPWDVYCEPPSKECKKSNGHSAAELEKNVKKVREEVVKPLTEDIQGYLSAGHAYGTQATGFIRDNVKYLQTSASEEVRMAAIAGGSLLGLILGIRKSFFRKLIYAGITGTSTAAIIYPKEAKIFAKEGYTYARGGIKTAIATLKDSRFEDQPKKSRKEKCASSVSDK